MALDPQENSLTTDLNVLLACKYTRIVYHINARQNVSNLMGIGNGLVAQYNGAPDIDLDILFYIDQGAILSNEDLFSRIEERIGEMLAFVDGSFTQRSVQPFREKAAMTVNYTVRLRDYDHFIQKVSQLARSKADKEFTKVLEEKIAE